MSDPIGCEIKGNRFVRLEGGEHPNAYICCDDGILFAWAEVSEQDIYDRLPVVRKVAIGDGRWKVELVEEPQES